MRVRIRGKVYETVEDAAKAFNVLPSTIRRKLSVGTEDTLRVKREDDTRGRPKPITICGLTFPNKKEANTALGLPDNYLTQALLRNSAKALAKVETAAKKYKALNAGENNE